MDTLLTFNPHTNFNGVEKCMPIKNKNFKIMLIYDAYIVVLI